MASLVDHFNDKFGIVTVLDATFYNTDDDTPLIEFDTLTVSNISAEGEQKEIRGGQGADLLMQYDYGRKAEIEITDALLSMDSLQKLWGSDDPINEFQYYGKEKFEAELIDSGGTVTVNGVPTDKYSSDLTVNKAIIMKEDKTGMDQELTLDNNNTFSGVEEALQNGNFSVADSTVKRNVIVYFKETSGADSKQLTLTTDNFPDTVHFVGTTFVIDQGTGKRKMMNIEIPKLKLGSSFEFTLEAEGDASTFDFSGVALSNDGDLIKMQYLGDVD